MNKEEKIEIIIVNLFRDLLKISDEKVLAEIYLGVKKIDDNKKNILLKELLEKRDKEKGMYSKGNINITEAKNKISEKFENSNEKIDINNLAIN